jgi:hypothetical protein
MSTGAGFADRLPSLIQPVLVAAKDAEVVAVTPKSNTAKANNKATFLGVILDFTLNPPP